MAGTFLGPVSNKRSLWGRSSQTVCKSNQSPCGRPAAHHVGKKVEEYVVIQIIQYACVCLELGQAKSLML